MVKKNNKKCMKSKYIREVRFWGLSVFLGLALGLGLQYAHAWTEPLQLPPNGNVGAPLNTSNVGQVKEGGLTLNTGGATNGLIVPKGRIGIGTSNPQGALHIVFNNTAADGTNGRFILENSGTTSSSNTGLFQKVNNSGARNGLNFCYGPNGDYNFNDCTSRAGFGYWHGSHLFEFWTDGGGTWSPKVTISQNGDISARSLTQYSDERLKKEITTIDGALDKVSRLNGVSFQWKDDSDTARKHLGVIAQNVETVFPEAVSTNADGMKSVEYDALIAPLIESIKELKAENDQLKARVDSLERIR